MDQSKSDLTVIALVTRQNTNGQTINNIN